MAAVTLPVTFLFAVFFSTGFQLNTIAMAIPTILMVYAVADGVHIVNNYLYQCGISPPFPSRHIGTGSQGGTTHLPDSEVLPTGRDLSNWEGTEHSHKAEEFNFSRDLSPFESLSRCVGRGRGVKQPYDKEIKIELIKSSLQYSLKPCFYTSLTTAASYLAFTTSNLKVLREMGLFAAIGIMLAFLLAFIIIGCALMWVKPFEQKTAKNPIISFSKNNWFRFVDRFQTPIIIGGLGIVLLVIPLINKITVGDNFMEYMKDGSTVKNDIYAIEKINGGFLPFEVLVKSTDSVLMTNRKKLNFIYDFQKKLVEDSLMYTPFSLVNLIRKAKNNESENILLRIKLDDEKELKKLLVENRSAENSELKAIINDSLTEIQKYMAHMNTGKKLNLLKILLLH